MKTEIPDFVKQSLKTTLARKKLKLEWKYGIDSRLADTLPTITDITIGRSKLEAVLCSESKHGAGCDESYMAAAVYLPKFKIWVAFSSEHKREYTETAADYLPDCRLEPDTVKTTTHEYDSECGPCEVPPELLSRIAKAYEYQGDLKEISKQSPAQLKGYIGNRKEGRILERIIEAMGRDAIVFDEPCEFLKENADEYLIITDRVEQKPPKVSMIGLGNIIIEAIELEDLKQYKHEGQFSHAVRIDQFYDVCIAYLPKFNEWLSFVGESHTMPYRHYKSFGPYRSPVAWLSVVAEAYNHCIKEGNLFADKKDAEEVRHKSPDELRALRNIEAPVTTQV